MTADAPAANQAGAALPAVGLASRIGFGEISVVPDGGEFIVGDPAAGVFLALPEVGVQAITELRSGRTIGEVAASLAEETGTEVDVAEFVAGLIEAGLVRSVDGRPMRDDGTGERQRRWIAGVRPERARLMFTRPAWALYTASFLWCVACLWLLPEYRPSFESILFYPDPAVSIVTIALAGIVLGSVHEAWHWLAGRAEGVSVRFALSRRAFLPVFETDLTQMWGIPRRRKYGPLLAGLAFDALVLAICLALRVVAEPLSIPPVLDRFLAVIVAVQVVSFGFQCLVFLRTDLYLVLSTALGCRDLLQVSRLYLKSRLWRLNSTQQARLADAHPRDLRLAPWFAVIYAAGIGLLAWFLVNVWLAATAVMGGWVIFGLAEANTGQRTFWEGLAVAAVLLSQAAWPLAVYVRQRITRGQGSQ
jgi:putative peptide zinc metalloprotease protein